MECLYNNAIESHADVVICDFWIDGVKHRKYKQIVSDDILLDFLTEKIGWSVWNKLVKRSLFDESFIFPRQNMAEDMLMALQYIIHGQNIVYLQKALYHYTFNKTSISHVMHRDQILIRYYSSKDNIDQAILILKNNALEYKYSKALEFFKYHVRRHLMPLLGERRYLNLWKNTYPEINKTFLANSHVSFRTRIQYILISSGIYTLFCKCISLFRLNLYASKVEKC